MLYDIAMRQINM